MNGLRQQLVMQQQNKKPLLTEWGRIEVTELGVRVLKSVERCVRERRTPGDALMRDWQIFN